MKRRRARESADGLALMTSSVTSSYSADDLREQSQESADSADALCVEIQQSQDTTWKHMFNTSWTTRRKQQQHPVVSSIEPAVAIYPVASFSVIVYPVDLVPRRKIAKRCIQLQDNYFRTITLHPELVALEPGAQSQESFAPSPGPISPLPPELELW
ncbi:hypothetical protein F511_28355 [Dorcoceras hygrometricum]|uniref:Uncharacterized protein n=1 Tax=Dorcoceras hygrometricum TaxID=472368 RepID=A0A2Z7D2G4_9LAMI|nr:hypothetical protein F511_28355 [Dorcoceras hygrometricum]